MLAPLLELGRFGNLLGRGKDSGESHRLYLKKTKAKGFGHGPRAKRLYLSLSLPAHGRRY